MDRLPQELVESIASVLLPGTKLLDEDDENWDQYAEPEKPQESLVPFVTVSRAWQAAVERRTFQSIKFDSEDLSIFKQALTPYRYSYLKRIVFTIILPSYDSATASKVETKQDKDANNQVYSEAIQSLFQILKSLETGQSRNGGIELFINHPKSRSDIQWYAGRGTKGPEGQIYEGRYFHSYIDMPVLDELPQLHDISGLYMKMPRDQLGHRMLYPRIPIQLASKMLNLEGLRVDLNDNERLYLNHRLDNRQELAECIQNLSLPKLQNADLHFLYSSPEDHRYMPPMLNPTADFDLLGSVCQSFSQGLKELSLNGVLDATLLRPLKGLEAGLWPELEQLDVHFNQVRPCGGWYFTGNPPVYPLNRESHPETVEANNDVEFNFDQEMKLIGMQPSCFFRSKPDDDAVSPLVEAFADAVAVMPKLRNAMLHSSLVEGGDRPEWFVIAYVAPCKRPDACQVQCHRLKERNLVTDLRGWIPNEGLMTKLRNMGSKFYDDSGVREESMAAFLDRHGQS